MSTEATMDRTDQRLVALDLANASWRGCTQIKRQLANGTLTLGEVLADPAIRSKPAYEVVSWVRGFGPARMQRLGRAAIDDNVNLATPVGRLSAYSQAWLAAHVRPLYVERPA